MPIIQQLFSSTWSIIMIILLFGGSIFIHELGHFLAAKKRGLQIDRFSIGFGPKLFSWNRDGVEYRISLLPFGGYVALPQLADMKGIEGQSELSVNELPPINYASKMIVSVMGAVFNVIFALILATVIWLIGYPTNVAETSHTIGYIVDEIQTENGNFIESPAKREGLQLGDTILKIDGVKIENWSQLSQALISGSGRTDDGRRTAELEIERNGEIIQKLIYPEISGDTKFRQIGIAPALPVVINELFLDPSSPANLASLQQYDELVSVDSIKLHSPTQFREYILNNADKEIELGIKRGNELLSKKITVATVKITTAGDETASIGIKSFFYQKTEINPSPLKQIEQHITSTVSTLSALINPKSDVGIQHMSGPPGIARILYVTSQIDYRIALWFTVLININLAIFNLLPIPVLDGGHMAFATIAKIRRKPLPINFVASVQGTFMILLFGLMIYVSSNDISRWVGDSKASNATQIEYIEPNFSVTGEPKVEAE
ncbi:site-2 protease family protein [Puniceicoccaceae bacterium K14]|nr:site-2 protease family protein [Puniceicoccaceae bacterium K14]